MGRDDKIWLELPKYSDEYINGVKSFIHNVFAKYADGDQLKCPCKECYNRYWVSQETLYDHLICNGPYPILYDWSYLVAAETISGDVDERNRSVDAQYGDNLNAMLHDMEQNEGGGRHGETDSAKKFYNLLEDGKQPLYPGCDKFSMLKFIIQLYLWKCTHGISEAAFSELLLFLREVFPHAKIPKSFNDAKRVIKDLGLDYKKIHACPNDCMLFWGENENDDACNICGASRWKVEEDVTSHTNSKGRQKSKKIPAKVIRYFPLIPRLQRMYMCKEYSELMVWHDRGRRKDGKLRHAADGKAWKSFDSMYPHFSCEPRNVRLGLASDSSHNTWPIVLVNYNLPPWLGMKPENLILSTLIPSPKSPGNNIDLYMQPLLKELKELWDVGRAEHRFG